MGILNWFKSKPQEPEKQKEPKVCPLCMDILDSLKHSPEDWKFDEYKATHCTGLRVWIANGAKYIDICTDECSSPKTFTGHEQYLIWMALEDRKAAIGKASRDKMRNRRLGPCPQEG